MYAPGTRHHIKAALDLGATPQEIAAASSVGIYRRREADMVSKACWGRPSSWQASRPRGLMQGPRLGAGQRQF
jgi:hypothetical protein